MLPAGLVVLKADAHRRVRVQVEALLGAARDQLAEVVAREPLAAIACRLHLGLIAVVPDEVNGLRLGIEALGVLVLDAIAIRESHLLLSILAFLKSRACARKKVILSGSGLDWRHYDDSEGRRSGSLVKTIWAYGQQAAVQQAAMVPRKRRRGRPSYNALPRDIEICRLVIWACREFREEGVRPTRNRADRRADLSPRRANRAPSGVSIVVAALARNGVHLVESSVREHVWFGWVGELVRADMHFCSL